jgi:hypothetical protein
LHIGLPKFKSSIPADRGEIGGDLLSFSGVLVFGGVFYLGDPFLVVYGVSVSWVFWSSLVLNVTQSVPQVNFLFGSGGENLSVVGRKCDGEHFFGVSLEKSSCLTSSEVPKSESLVPR